MDLMKKNINYTDEKSLSILKREQAHLKDLLKRYNEVKSSDKIVFIPLIKSSKIAFFQAIIKPNEKCFLNIGDYIIESTIPRKINNLIKAISQVDKELKNINNNSERISNNNANKTEKDNKMINSNNIDIPATGQLKKLNENLYEIIEEDNSNISEKVNYQKSHTTKDNIISKNEQHLKKNLEEIKTSKDKYKNKDFISFIDMEFLD